MKPLHKYSLALVSTVLASIVTVAQIMPDKPQMPNVDVVVQHFGSEEVVKYPWGEIRWLMNSKIDHGAAQTFGIVQINKGQHNALHAHPNSEELLYVLSGSCEHVVGNKRVTLHPGDLVRVPAGVPHQAFVTGNEPLRAVISYSSPDRKVVNYGKTRE